MHTPPRTLSIAGTDPGGGAGIHADLKTFTSLQTYGLAVTSALTAQNTLGVQAVEAVRPEFVAQQIDSVLSDIGVDAIKTGMLHDKHVIRQVVECITKQYPAPKSVPIVVDPVVISTSGHRLLSVDSIDAYKNLLIPMATIITPNLPEAKLLADVDNDITDIRGMVEASRKIANLGCPYVLCKGGHLPETDKVVDVLFNGNDDTYRVIEHTRIESKFTHGTGCTLSAAICSFAARSFNVPDSVTEAIKYTQNALADAFPLGKGTGPVNHLTAMVPRLIPARTEANPFPFTSYITNTASDIWQEYTRNNPFVSGMKDGTLPRENFLHFLRQDYIFLKNYARIYALAAYKSDDYEKIDSATDIVKNVVRESKMHIDQCAQWGVSKEELEQTPEANHTVAYTRYVLDVSNAKSLLHLRVATAPCLLGYGEIGLYLYNDKNTKREGNPYWKWICEYSGEDYQAAVRLGREELEDAISEGITSQSLLNELANIFSKATRLEIGFFEQGLTRDLRY